MNLKAIGRLVASKVAEHSPEILTGLGILGFGTTCVMVAKAAPSASISHMREKSVREDIEVFEATSEDATRLTRESYIREAKELGKLYGPAAAVGVASVACFLGASKIHMDRQAAVMAAYSLSTETLARYQDKVIEKLGEDVHSDILGEATKEMASAHAPENDPMLEPIPAGTVRIYDNVTGRYFYGTREKVVDAESAINRRLIDEVRVPLQEFYYEMGLEENFNLGEAVGWDLSNPYSARDNTLNVWFTPHLDDDKNPCLALNYHVMVFDRRA